MTKRETGTLGGDSSGAMKRETGNELGFTLVHDDNRMPATRYSPVKILSP
jgi:hypothetical protein